MPSHIDFPVVGIGASAGGLPALIRFFENMPQRTGMAFVVILHLSPKHQSSADNVLQRATGMPVIQVVTPVLLEPDHVYVIAPNKQLSMVDGHLGLSEMERPRGGHIAIDIFFRTLAEVHRERAIAIVLSGTGSDGAVGLTRIKEQGGLTLVQAPEDAEHDGMPQAAIRTGMVDFVLPVVDLPQKLVDLWDNARIIELPPTGDGEKPVAHLPDPAAVDQAEDALQRIIAILLSHTGRDFRQYKRATVLRRIERRLQVRGLHTLPDYCALLESDPREHAALLDDMLIGVTNFFRDREAFEAIEREIVPELFKDRGPKEEVRVWVAACSTGEEAYSMAMLLADHMSELAQPPSFQVFASDIDEHAIVQARNGIYPSSIITDVAPVRLRQHFAKDADRYRIRKAIRDRILFAAHDVLRDPPFSRLDLVSCRNLLIYLNRDAQSRVLEMFHFALKPGGYLFLGSSESAESVGDYFIPVDKKNRIYRARPTARIVNYRGGQVSGNVSRMPDSGARQPARRQFSYAEVHQRALAQVAPPSVVLDRESNIVHMSQPAGQFLRMGGGEPSRNVLALVLPELRLELRSALYQVHQNGARVDCRPIAVQLPGRTATIGMKVQSYRDEESAGEFALVLFTEMAPELVVPPPEGDMHSSDVVLIQLEAELQRIKEQLRETIEYSEVSTEELRASNEELQAINEELRSATEELETSKEELQSVNEELITVNYELKVKVEETGKANDDLNNLIASTDIATVFVDSALRIKRFTPRAADIFSIIPSDLGRSLLDLTHRLDYDELADDVSATFESLRPVEREVRSNDGRCYIVRLLPYRTIEDRIEGAVMTFFDISARRLAEELVRASEARMRLVAESTHDYAIITTDAAGRVISWNKGAERMFGYTEQEILGGLLDRLFVPEDLALGAPGDEMRRAREEGRAEDERWHLRKDGSRFYASGITTPLGPNATYGYAKIARDQTDRLRQSNQRDEAISHEQRERYSAESASAMKDEFLAIMSHELRQPLNMININAELLSRVPEVRQSSTALRCAKAIRQSVMSQAKIIEDLLDMSRVRTGKLALSVAPVDIGKVVGAIVETAHADPVSRGLEISLSIADEGMSVMADEVRLEQVVMNLLSNAIKFTPAGGRIEVRLAREDGKARIDVADTGQGIAPGCLPKIFDMFGQPNSVTTRAKGGLGIGLALVRELVSLHGGQIEAYSGGIGKGALFSIWLPLLERQHPAADAEAETRSPHINGLRILVVDDAEDAVEVMKTLLGMHGARVLTATSAQEALGLLEREPVDLLVSDISMPGMDGYALLREVRAMPRHAHLPAVAVTGLGREQDIAQAREAGFAAHIGKPVSIDRLMAIIPELLRRRAS